MSASSDLVEAAKYLRILARALGVRTMFTQSREGLAFLLVRISMRSPVASGRVSDTTEPFTLAPTQWFPTSVCTA